MCWIWTDIQMSICVAHDTACMFGWNQWMCSLRWREGIPTQHPLGVPPIGKSFLGWPPISWYASPSTTSICYRSEWRLLHRPWGHTFPESFGGSPQFLPGGQWVTCPGQSIGLRQWSCIPYKACECWISTAPKCQWVPASPNYMDCIGASSPEKYNNSVYPCTQTEEYYVCTDSQTVYLRDQMTKTLSITNPLI